MLRDRAGVGVALGTRLGFGACGIAALIAAHMGFPLRLPWFTDSKASWA